MALCDKNVAESFVFLRFLNDSGIIEKSEDV